MKLVRHKRRRLLLSYSMWAVYAAGFFQVLPYALPYLDSYLPSWVSLVALALSPLGALIEQRNLHPDDKA